MSKEMLMNELLKTPYSKPASGGSELVVRCPFCGDSTKSNNPHMYIGIDEVPIKFDCKKCEAGGLFTPGALSKLGIYNGEVMQFVKNQIPVNRTTRVLSDSGAYIQVSDYDVIPKELKDHKSKIDYLSSRTGLDFSKKSTIKKYRVIFSIKDFHTKNKIKYQPDNKDMVNELDANYVGFLSHDKRSIQFRYANDSSSKRYYFYPLFEERKPFLYLPAQQIDILAPKPKICLTEGPIGAIVVRSQFYPDDAVDVIVGSALSLGTIKRGFLSIVEKTAYVGAEVRIYSDPEVEVTKYKKMFNIFTKSFDFKIIYNQVKGGKDFNNYQNGFEPKIYNM